MNISGFDFIGQFADHPLSLAILMLGALIGVYLWKYAKHLPQINKKIDEIIAHDKKQDEQIKTLTFQSLRKAIYNSQLPLSERMAAAVRYLKAGGNCEAKEYIETGLRPQDKNMFAVFDAQIKQEKL